MTIPGPTVWNVAKPQIRNVVRSKWLICYSLFFLAATEGLLRFNGPNAKTLLSLSNVVLFVVPLVTIVYGTIYLYNSREFIELLLAQPVKRRTVFAGLYAGLGVPLTAAFMVGVLTPLVFHGSVRGFDLPLITIMTGGAALTLIFTGLSFCIALRFEDRLTGLGAGMAAWLLLALVYDGVILFVVSVLADHSMEKSLLAVSLANPIDLVRIATLLQFDIAALMGYTGAVFSQFFSGASGLAVIAAALTLWVGSPFFLGLATFEKKDF